MWAIAGRAGIAGAALVVFAGWIAGRWGGDAAVDVADNLGLIVFAAWATGHTVQAARAAHGRQRRAWVCIAVGTAGWTAGSMAWTYFDLVLNQSPFPSIADLGFVLFPVGVCVGMVLFAFDTAGPSTTRAVLDGVIVAASLFAISYLTVQSIYRVGGASAFAVGLSLAYPVWDLVIIAIAFMVLARARTTRRGSLVLLTMGVGLMGLADIGFCYLNAHGAYLFDGNLIDIGWAAGLLLIGLAARLHAVTGATEDASAAVPSKVAIWLPYVPLMVAAVLCTLTFLPTPGLAPLVLVIALAVFAVLIRQVMVINENRALRARVADQAWHDPLTGVANRVLFDTRLAQAVARGEPIALLVLDLDEFKLVNDNMGHAAGDELLVLAARRIVDSVYPRATVARLGGDEFAVLIDKAPADGAMGMATRITDAFGEPFVLYGHELPIRISVGLAQSTGDASVVSAATLMTQARMAMNAFQAGAGRAGAILRTGYGRRGHRRAVPVGGRHGPRRRGGGPVAR